MFDLLPLSELEAGQSAEIAQLVGPPDDVHRLEELGLRPGVRIELVQGGSPCILRVGGAKLCFRSTELFGILVRAEVTV